MPAKTKLTTNAAEAVNITKAGALTLEAHAEPFRYA
jgi:hypothetical protein